MFRNHLPRTAAAAVAAATVLPLAASSAIGAPAGDHPYAGSAGIGDRLFPTLGNGGYDAKHYDLRLRYATSAPTQGIDGTVTMVARSTHALSRFDLDFAGSSVGSVLVNGRRASFTRTGEELVITPARPIRDHRVFVVRVRHFRSKPTPKVNPDDPSTTVFFSTPDGSAMAGQPNGSHRVYPSNDHPRDKATFSFRFDVPAGETAAANGVLTGRHTYRHRTIWRYVQRQPMATELTQLAVGRFTIVRRGSVNGVPVRDVVPTRLLSDFRKNLAVEKSQMRWMERRVGAFPFDRYGSLIVDAQLPFTLETQTLTIYPAYAWGIAPTSVLNPIMLHELSHEWFGDNVSPWAWSDVWLNEGHASWYEFTYADQMGDLPDEAGAANLTALMRDTYAQGDQYRHDYGPVARPLDASVLFSPNVYQGGALVLYALRQRVGRPAFMRIERAWVHTYGGRSASTADFIRLASRVSGRDLHGFLTRWLYGRKTPPMPGHPHWTVDPVTPGASAHPNAARHLRAAAPFGLTELRRR